MNYARLGLSVVLAFVGIIAVIALILFFGLIALGVVQLDLVQTLISWSARLVFTVGVLYGLFDSIGRALPGRCLAWSPLAWLAATAGMALHWYMLLGMVVPSPYGDPAKLEAYGSLQSLALLLIVGGIISGLMGSSRRPEAPPYPDEDLG